MNVPGSTRVILGQHGFLPRRCPRCPRDGRVVAASSMQCAARLDQVPMGFPVVVDAWKSGDDLMIFDDGCDVMMDVFL